MSDSKAVHNIVLAPKKRGQKQCSVFEEGDAPSHFAEVGPKVQALRQRQAKLLKSKQELLDEIHVWPDAERDDLLKYYNLNLS